MPFAFVIEDLGTVDDMAVAIKDMHVRGAGLISDAGYGMYIAAITAPRDPAGFDAFMLAAAAQLKATRPTAVNLEWGADRQLAAMAAAGDDVEAKIGGVAHGPGDRRRRRGFLPPHRRARRAPHRERSASARAANRSTC
ncbi:MAG: hypothetical protein R2851_20310 [Caldilineaceae bacterium]